MSLEMAEKKHKEIEDLEKQEKADLEAQERDVCPNCGMKACTFRYINAALLPFGLLECTACGVVFSPESMRIEKAKMVKDGRGRDLIPANKL